MILNNFSGAIMKNSILRAFMAAFLCLALQNCSNNSPTSGGGGGVIGKLFPLQIGNSWTYKTSYYDSLGHVIATVKVTDSIPRDTVVSGETWYFYADQGTLFWTNRSDGVWRWPVIIGQTNPPVLFYKYATYKGDMAADSTDPAMITVISTISADSAITTDSLGTFSRCCVYREDNFSGGVLVSTAYSCFAPDVGLILRESYHIIPPPTYKISRKELTRYLLK
jgi:hypothetical protein